MSNLLRCFGFTENRLHLGKAQARWATPKPLRLGHAQAREWLGMALDLLGALALLSVCTVFRDSNSVTNRSARRTQRASFYMHSAEAKPALAAKQQQYAPSFSLSAHCILLTLTHRLRFISSPCFDTPSCARLSLPLPQDGPDRHPPAKPHRTSPFMNRNILVQTYIAPCGTLLLGSFHDKLCLCNWTEGKHPGRVDRRLQAKLAACYMPQASDITQAAARQLDEYFLGQRKSFDLPLLFAGSSFQESVWKQLMDIPYGQTVSYGEIARRIGRPTAVRAVANANGANAISIFAPCHRVIGNDHSLTGYGGGIEAKRFLLCLESGRPAENLRHGSIPGFPPSQSSAKASRRPGRQTSEAV